MPEQMPEQNVPYRPEKCVFVIFNPASGNIPPEQRQEVISSALADQGYTCQFIHTTREQGAGALAHEAIQQGADLIAVSGGDGTIIETLSALVGTDIPVAVLPAGTGNLLSVNLGIPSAIPEAVIVALSGVPYELDLARTSNGQYFAIMGGMGLDGQIMKEADRDAKNRLGVFAYVLATARNLSRKRAPVEIRIDDRPVLRRRVKSVLIANMGRITGGVAAIPTAIANDGLLDIGIISTRTPLQWLHLLALALIGRTQDDPTLEVYQARSVRIHSRSPQPVQFDGETDGNKRELSVEIVPRAVRVLLPEDAPAFQHNQKEKTTEKPQPTSRQRPILMVILLLLTAGIIGAWLFYRRKRK